MPRFQPRQRAADGENREARASQAEERSHACEQDMAVAMLSRGLGPCPAEFRPYRSGRFWPVPTPTRLALDGGRALSPG
jgi:hypothetical protein